MLVTKNTRSCLENPYNAVHLRDDDMCSMYSVPQMCPTIKIGIDLCIETLMHKENGWYHCKAGGADVSGKTNLF